MPHEVSGRDALARARSGLDACITASAGNRLAWAQALADSVAAVGEAIQEHRHGAEGPAGTLQRMVDRAPRLGSRARAQEIDHTILLGEAAMLEGAILEQINAGNINVEVIRGRASFLLDRVRMHVARAADLLYEAYYSDIGGES